MILISLCGAIVVVIVVGASFVPINDVLKNGFSAGTKSRKVLDVGLGVTSRGALALLSVDPGHFGVKDLAAVVEDSAEADTDLVRRPVIVAVVKVAFGFEDDFVCHFLFLVLFLFLLVCQNSD